MAEAYKGKQKIADIEARRKASANFTLELPDITTEAQRKEPLIKKPADKAALQALVNSTPGYQEVRPSAGTRLPSMSWSMKRATRVPASMVVRINSASNMMAK